MALMGVVLADLREELVTRVYGITPEIKPAQLWVAHEPDAATDFDAATGSPRLFKIGWWETTQKTIGYIYRKHEALGLVKVHYGKTDEDRTAAVVDVNAITRALDGTSWGSVTGVDYCVVDPEQNHTIEDTGEGDGILLTVPLFAVIETTA